MFHLAIVFMPLLVIALIGTLVTGVGLLITALVGGASAALVVRDKRLRRLLLLGCGILALVGITCVSLVLSWSYWVTASCCAAVIVLSILGLCGSKCIANKYGRVGSIMLFAFAAAAALLFGIIVVAMGIG
ncbi:hypothetical protein [Vescimonas sp.]|uniref:hypothetical protein n=1 Tax=Vescimonas sp. TaxID=2892404 RepID=UPI00307A733E